MSKIYETVIVAIRDHWKSHDNRYPQKIVLTSVQYEELLNHRRAGRVALNDTGESELTSFMGTPLLVDDTTQGVIFGCDGTPKMLIFAD